MNDMKYNLQDVPLNVHMLLPACIYSSETACCECPGISCRPVQNVVSNKYDHFHLPTSIMNLKLEIWTVCTKVSLWKGLLCIYKYTLKLKMKAMSIIKELPALVRGQHQYESALSHFLFHKCHRLENAASRPQHALAGECLVCRGLWAKQLGDALRWGTWKLHSGL